MERCKSKYTVGLETDGPQCVFDEGHGGFCFGTGEAGHVSWPIGPYEDFHRKLRGKKTTARRVALQKAADLIDGDRNKDYGEPIDNFTRIARLWSVVIGREVTVAEVASMLALVKIARLVHQPDHTDSWIDLAGYAGIGAELTDGNV